MTPDDLAALKAAIAAELAPIRAQFATELAALRAQMQVIEDKVTLLPDLRFLHASATAQEVVAALRKASGKPPSPHEPMPVPPDSSHRRPDAMTPRRS